VHSKAGLKPALHSGARQRGLSVRIKLTRLQQIEKSPRPLRRIDKSAENAWGLSIPSGHFGRESFRSAELALRLTNPA